MQPVEVLWTPQNENDIFSGEELLDDYPSLRPLSSSSSTASQGEDEDRNWV